MPINAPLDRLTHKLIHTQSQDGLTSGQGAPGSLLAYTQQPASVTGLTTTLTDITSVTATVTVPAGRQLRIRGHVIAIQGTAVENKVAVYIMEGATKLGFAEQALNPTVGTSSTLDPECIVSPSAGTHTYKLAGQFNAGSSNQFYQDPTNGQYCFITVEDITGNQLPYNPLSVPVGLLAQAYNFGNGFNFTTRATIPGASLNVTVPAGRVLKISAKAHLYSTTATDRLDLFILQDGAVLDAAYKNNVVSGQGQDTIASITTSPSAGAHTYTLQVQRDGTGTGSVYSLAGDSQTWFLIEDITPTPAPTNSAPSSTLGYAEVTTSQTGISTITDLTGLSVTVTVPGGRRIKITGKANVNGSIASNTPQLTIREGSTQLQAAQIQNSSTAGNGTILEGEVVLTPSAGTHTYKLSLELSAGTGTVGMAAAATFPSFILVEDITPASVYPTAIVPGNLVVNSSARPANPSVGTVIYESDTGKVWVWDGTAWVPPRNVAQGWLAGVGDYNDTAARALSKGAAEAVVLTTPAIQTYANRRYKIRGFVSTSAGGAWTYAELRIRRGTNTTGFVVTRQYQSRTNWQQLWVEAHDVPGAQAAQQWTFTHALDTSVCDLFNPAALYVEDAGAA